MTSSRYLECKDIAEMLGVQQRTVYMWKRRGLLPPPARVIGRSPVWTERRILSWARATGRLEEATA